MKKRKSTAYIIIELLIFLKMIFASYGYPQDYKINPEDILKITFLEHPELNKTTKVGLDGNISLPVVSNINAEGLTISELTQKIISEFSIYSISVTKLSVEIVAYESNKIYVTGHVTTPGKYVFEEIPDLWVVISEAGGPTESANLNNVLIIHSGKEKESTTTVNLAEILQNGNFSELPELKAGDNIFVPGVVGSVGGRSLEAIQPKRHIIYIYGEINNAGIHTFDQSVNLLEAIVMAGGPTRDAELSDIRVIRRASGSFSRVIKVDIEWYVEDARHDFFRLVPEDIIYIPRKKTWKETIIGTAILNFALPVGISTLMYQLLN